MGDACMDLFDSTPPWLNGKPQACMDEVTLHDEIQMFCKWISPTREEQMMRESVIVRISCVVCQLWPTAQVKTYGSYATQLYLPNSDVDLCVTGAPPGPQSLVTLAEVLHAKELSTQLHVISSAKVPIIKLTDKVSGSIVDISLNQDVRTTELVASYMERFPSLRPLTLILKLFLFQRRLHESYTGGLSSFSLMIIIVSFLQFHVPDCTSKHGLKIASKSNLGTLLIDFFKFFGKQFDYEHMGISIRDAGSYFPKMSRNWYDPFNPCVFSLESPLDPACDVGRGGFATPRVVAAFANAYEQLTSGKTSRLSSVLMVDSTIIERRNQIANLYTRQVASPSPPHPHPPHRTQRSISATATLQTVTGANRSVSIPIPPIPETKSSIPAAPSALPASSTAPSVVTEGSNPILSSSSHSVSPPSPPSSLTPIHISPATSPRHPHPLASSAPHPTISGFESKTPPDSSTDTDTDTDVDADVDTDSGDLQAPLSSISKNGIVCHEPVVSAKVPFYNCHHHSMSGLDHYLRTMQSHFQSLQPLAGSTRHSKSSKSGKRLQKLQQLQQQLTQHSASITDPEVSHNAPVNNHNRHPKAKPKNKNCNNSNNSSPVPKPSTCIISESSTTPTPSAPATPSDSTTPTLPPTAPTITTAKEKGRRNSNPHNRRNSNPNNRRNSNPNNRRNSNTPTPATSAPSTPAASALSNCTSIPETPVAPSSPATPSSTPTISAPTITITTPTPTTPPTTQTPIDFNFKQQKNFRATKLQQQRWAPKSANAPKKLNVIQSPVPVSN